MWWHKHVWIIVMQVIAFIPYLVGSRKFYRYKNDFMTWLAVGIILDIIMAIVPMIFKLPRMENGQGAPWSSKLFFIHIVTAGIGMFGFIAMFIYLLINRIRGTKRFYFRLRRFQYRFLLRMWILGVTIALVNFFAKAIYNIRIYDYF